MASASPAQPPRCQPSGHGRVAADEHNWVLSILGGAAAYGLGRIVGLSRQSGAWMAGGAVVSVGRDHRGGEGGGLWMRPSSAGTGCLG